VAEFGVAIDLRHVDMVFGAHPERALALLDEGYDRPVILDRTGLIVGAHDASIHVQEGEICVLMGLSGSGKSTLMRCVNGLNRATRGEVLVRDGERMIDVMRCDRMTLRHLRTHRVAMVFQQFALLPWRTVEQNVGLGLELRGVGHAERAEVVAEKLELVGLTVWKDKFGHELSGGMQQRVGLARAFATDADILLMDEPFSALDPLIRSRLQDELLALQRKLRKTILFVSHDLDEALKLGTHIAIMEDGRIVQYGEPEHLVLNPANEYVADFVANLNPLNVLRGASLMTGVADLSRDAGELLLDGEGRVRLRLNGDGGPGQVMVDGAPAPIVALAPDVEPGSVQPATGVISTSPRISMRAVIELRRASGAPLLFVEDGRFVGVVGDEEIYRGLLRGGEGHAARP